MTILDKQEALRTVYGDKVDEMSTSEIESHYNQLTHQVSPDAIMNQPRKTEQRVFEEEMGKTSIPAGTASPVEFNQMQAAAKDAAPDVYEDVPDDSANLSIEEAMTGNVDESKPKPKPAGSITPNKASAGSTTNDTTGNTETNKTGVTTTVTDDGGGGGDDDDDKDDYTYGPKSILKAYYDGDIDASTRDYMLADVIAKFVRNTGKDIGNIGAQYSGGTIDNNKETSDWEGRNAEILKQQTSAQSAKIENSDKAMERAMQKIEQTAGKLKNEQAGYTLSAAKRLRELYDDTNDPMLKSMYAVLMSDVSDGNVSQGALIGIAAASTPAEIKHLIDLYKLNK